MFTNVSAVKELGRQQAKLGVHRMMNSAFNHELRTPCNVII